jgi:hypothetical protein
MKRFLKFLKRIYLSLFLLAIMATNAHAESLDAITKAFKGFAYLLCGIAILYGGLSFIVNIIKFYKGRDTDEGFESLKSSLIGVGIAVGGIAIIGIIYGLADFFFVKAQNLSVVN